MLMEKLKKVFGKKINWLHQSERTRLLIIWKKIKNAWNLLIRKKSATKIAWKIRNNEKTFRDLGSESSNLQH